MRLMTEKCSGNDENCGEDCPYCESFQEDCDGSEEWEMDGGVWEKKEEYCDDNK